MGIEKKAPGIAGYLACLGYYGLVWFEGQHYVTLLAIAALMVLMSIYVFTFPKYGTEQITVAFFGIFSSGNYAFLPVSGAGNGGRKIPCLADLFKLLGL